MKINSLVWEAETLKGKKALDLPKEIREGWGITSRQEKGPDGVSRLYFYISDGSANIYVVDPETFTVVKTLLVKIKGISLEIDLIIDKKVR